MIKNLIPLVERGGKTEAIYIQSIPEDIYRKTVNLFLLAHGHSDFEIPMNESELNKFSMGKKTKKLKYLIKIFEHLGYQQEMICTKPY